MLKMSSAIDAAFFLSLSQSAVNLSVNFFFIQHRGKACLSIDFRFVTQCVVRSNGIINVFTYFTFNQSYRRGLFSVLSRIFCSYCSICGRREEMEVRSRIGQESCAA